MTICRDSESKPLSSVPVSDTEAVIFKFPFGVLFFFGFDYSAALVSAAAGAGMVGESGLSALRTACNRRSADFLVSSSFVTV